MIDIIDSKTGYPVIQSSFLRERLDRSQLVSRTRSELGWDALTSQLQQTLQTTVQSLEF